MQEIKPRKKIRKRSIKKRDSEEFGKNNENEEEKDSSKLRTSNSVNVGTYLFTFILLIVALLIYDITFAFQDTIDVQAIKTDLLTNVYNQNDSVYMLLDCLNQMYEHEQNQHIVNFIGSTGVGKTFIANILKRHFHSVYELNGPLHNSVQQNAIHKLKYGYSNFNLIIVEDLAESDVDNVLVFLKEVPKDLVALVICIFNIQETDNELTHTINYSNVDKIIQKFNNAEVPHKVAKFNEFDRKQAQGWVINELIKKGINFDYHSKIVETVLRDEDIKFHGLKGLSSKLNLEL